MKSDIVVYTDVGLVGSFVRFDEHGAEKGYVYLDYVPLNTFPIKVHRFPSPIPRTAIHHAHTIKNIKGIDPRIIYIYTAEQDSIVKDIFGSLAVDRENELLEKIKKLRIELTSVKQEATDARSGVSKTLSNMKEITKSQKRDAPPIFGSRFRSPFDEGVDTEDDE